MGLFGWLGSHWAPTYDYRDYNADEVDEIALESTTAGSRRGFLLGVPIGGLMAVAVIGGAVMTGLYTPPFPTAASREAQRDTAAAQAMRHEVTTLRDENQALQKQVLAAQAATTCPPCQPQAVGTAPPQAHAVAPPPPPARPATPKATAPRKARVPVPDDQVAPPIPSNCRQAGDCQ